MTVGQCRFEDFIVVYDEDTSVLGGTFMFLPCISED